MIPSMLNKVVLGAVFAAGLLLKSDARHPLDDTKVQVSIVHEKKWTLDDLSVMAKSRTVANAVSSLTSTAQDTGEAPKIRLKKIVQTLRNTAALDVRAAIITSAEAERRWRSEDDKQIADFARSVNPAATCATHDTAGGHGLDVCIAGCAEASTYLAWASRAGSCDLLCALATSPCDNEFFSATAIVKGWAKSAAAAAEWTSMPLAKEAVFALASSPATMIAAIVAATLAYELWMKPTAFRKMRAHVFLTEQGVALQRRDQVKAKGAILARTHARLRERRALHALHDFSALATYRAAQEAAEAEAEAAKAVAVNKAIETVAAEQAAWDKGGGGSVVS